MSLGSLQPCTCTVECGCVEHQGEGLGDDNGPVPNCPIDVKDVPKVRTIGLRATSRYFFSRLPYLFSRATSSGLDKPRKFEFAMHYL